MIDGSEAFSAAAGSLCSWCSGSAVGHPGQGFGVSHNPPMKALHPKPTLRRKLRCSSACHIKYRTPETADLITHKDFQPLHISI